MAATRLTNIIVPAVWNPYVIERTAELSAFFQSGIIAPVEEIAGFIADGGNTLNMPFWKDLSGDDEVLSATGTALTVNPIETGQDISVVLARGRAWGTNELAAALSGDDPAGAIAELVAAYWARRMQAASLAVLKGVFSAASMATNVHDISAATGEAAVISGSTFVDAAQRMGDNKGKLTAVAMHSATEAALLKADLIEFRPDSEGRLTIPTFMGKTVVVDDGLPVGTGGSAGIYDTYLFGAGALGLADGTGRTHVTATETDRDSLAGEDILINRRHFVLHPRGVKWKGTATGGGPDNTALGTGTNWERVYESKNVRIVLFRHRIVPAAGG